MKYLKNPLFPLFILSVILSVFGYNYFFYDYTEIEKSVFSHNYQQNIDLKYEYINLAERTKKEAENKFLEEGRKENEFSEKTYKSLKTKMDSLGKIYSDIHLNYFEKPRLELREETLPNTKEVIPKFPPKVPNIKIVSVFNEYIKKVSELDSSLASSYKNFVFEEGMTDEQLHDFYFDADDYLRAFHYSRFEAQLANMYYEDSKQLTQSYFLYPLDLKIEDAKVVPYIEHHSNLGKYSIAAMSVFPFNKQKSTLIYSENIETKFDENGFIIFPKEFQKGMQQFGVRIPLLNGNDTTLTMKIDFDYKKE
ncbi:hypothetical protein ACE193_18670 [Bernardetia sp. OM2101]|uniref:hypothetical protein n=1 Tax=Bernardetia sp. OM2101 TaxID=3344876 RepID=UPI0035CE8F94